jgi:ATP-dependent Clp protease adaptor protein ClpS
MSAATGTLYEQDLMIDDVAVSQSTLVIYNDDVNSFDWVIKALIEICKHTKEQAEQCSLIIHHKGKYAVKHGSYEKLKPMKDAISDRGINVTIE